MRGIFIGAVFVLLLFGCTKETKWVDKGHYPSGEVQRTQEYYMDNNDSILVYEKVLYQNGKVWMEGPLKEGERDGLWRAYYSNGDTWSESEFSIGMRHGVVNSYYENKQLRYTGFFYDDRSDGKWVWYDSTGTIEKEVDFTFQKDK